MNVCVVAEYYPRRRDRVLGVWAHRQALAARDAGADVTVLALERPVPPAAALKAASRGDPGPLARELGGAARQPRRELLDGLEVEYVRFLAPPRGRSYSRWHGWAGPPLRRALERTHHARPLDLVHAHYALPAGGAARPFAAAHRLPLVVSVHGGDILGRQLAAPGARAEVAGVLRAARAVLCNSAFTLDRAAALAGTAERMRVVHLGAEAPPDPPPRRDGPAVASLGHLVERKRHADVLHALARVRDRLPGLRWVVIGDGPEAPALESLAAELGVGDMVDWHGRLEPEDALTELARCHLMALPSVDEAFGVAYVEALACGVPAIGCRGEGGPEEIAALGDGMILVPPHDPPALAEAIAATLGDPGRLEELSTAAQRTAREHFSWEGCGRATVAAYRDALAAAG